MPRIHELGATDDALSKDLSRSFQSGHINFLIGSGASQPAIPLAGQVEQDIEALQEGGNHEAAARRIYELLSSVQGPCNRLIMREPTAGDTETLKSYETFFRAIETILTERRTTVLPKQATVFTTNYDIFIDTGARACPGVALATGFDGAQSTDDFAAYSSGRFFLTTYDTGNLYDYRVEIPSINLVKLHGCVSWQKDTDRILRRTAYCELPADPNDAAAVRAFIERYGVILPQTSKFNRTVLDQTYYELLRLYANALDRANVLLVVFGFSFRDEHIAHITRRALKNPTLRLVVFAYDVPSRDAYATMFSAHNNVHVIAAPASEPVDFERFNAVIAASVPQPEPKK